MDFSRISPRRLLQGTAALGALRVQRPYLLGGLLAFHQPADIRRQSRSLGLPRGGVDARQGEPQRSRLGGRVATEHRQQVEHVGAFDLVDRSRQAGFQRRG